ncbi:MAG: Transcriptional regulator, TrmB [uncultured bacterium]|uniref:Transcriptional regulator, TrmB n=1 Tax=Candidatus Wolfebacteria bacterium GW2011_GWE2_44_13 TaxID=1619017 RepID=A0A0G1JGP4_9BACT|nr:MAG: Transcriptional regulator, TrmB [uncultured bacterium]KKT43172.1 MAG: Transcriptional regulator, TrmB [Candidatus Wolfebacteria bacterium GW2011_GWE2_44_13]
MLEKTLLQLGLDEKEASIYLAALSLGPSSIQNISKKSGVNRSTIYTFLSELKSKNLISETISGRKRLFVATDPEELKGLLVRQQAALDKIMPELKGLFNIEAGRPKIRFFETLPEIKQIHLSLLDEGPKEIFAFLDIDEFTQVMGWDWTQEYVSKRLSKKIPIKVIANEHASSRDVYSRNKEEFREMRIFPGENPFWANIEIYPSTNKIFITSLKKEKWALVIESETIISTLKIFFNFMWERLD